MSDLPTTINEWVLEKDHHKRCHDGCGAHAVELARELAAARTCVFMLRALRPFSSSEEVGRDADAALAAYDATRKETT